MTNMYLVSIYSSVFTNISGEININTNDINLIDKTSVATIVDNWSVMIHRDDNIDTLDDIIFISLTKKNCDYRNVVSYEQPMQKLEITAEGVLNAFTI